MNLQMLLSGCKKGFFCVADVKFEEKIVTTEVEIDLDEKFCAALMRRSGNFWKNCIFPKLC
jgi:dUTPase